MNISCSIEKHGDIIHYQKCLPWTNFRGDVFSAMSHTSFIVSTSAFSCRFVKVTVSSEDDAAALLTVLLPGPLFTGAFAGRTLVKTHEVNITLIALYEHM